MQLTSRCLLTFVVLVLPSVAASADDLFDGVDESGRVVMKKARQEIERVRKGDFEVRFRTADGQPVQGTVELHHVSHEFRFGAPFSTSQAFLDFHNLGTNEPALAESAGGRGRAEWPLSLGALRSNVERCLRARHRRCGGTV